MRPGIAMEIGFKRGTDVGSVGCPWTAHFPCFGTVKTVPGLCKMGHKCPCVVCLKWYEMNGLS